MLRPPIFNKKFGGIKIKVWSYPKQTFNCLINGLRTNSNTINKVSSVVAFHHRFYEDSGGCNCLDKIENLCFKYSSQCQRQGKIYVPLKIINCSTDSDKIFIAELRCVPEACKTRHKYTPVLAVEPPDCFDCLIDCQKMRSRSSLKKCCESDEIEIERQREYYEKVIKELMNITKLDGYVSRKKNSIDKTSILELCLQNDVPTKKIITLLREFESNKCFQEEALYKKCINCKENIPNCHEDTELCTNCSPKKFNPRPNYSNHRKKMFKIIPSSSPENCHYQDDYDIDCQRPISSECNIENTNPRFYKTSQCDNRSSNFGRDIMEIKTILNDIIDSMGCNGVSSNKAFPGTTTDLCDLDCVDDKTMNVEDLRNAIFQQRTPGKVDCNERFGIQNDYCSQKQECDTNAEIGQYGQDRQRMYIPVMERSHDQIYARLPKTIPIITKAIFPTLDAYEDASKASASHLSPDCKPKTDMTDLAYTPFNPSDPQCLNDHKLSPPENRSGVTNIYYYINSDGRPVAPSPLFDKRSITPIPPPDYTVIPPLSTPQPPPNLKHGTDIPPNEYPHIVIDLNPTIADNTDNPQLIATEAAQTSPQKLASLKNSVKKEGSLKKVGQ